MMTPPPSNEPIDAPADPAAGGPARNSSGAPPDGASGGPPAGSPGEASEPSPWRSAVLWLAAGAGAFLLSYLAAQAPWLVDAVYGRAVGPAVAWLLSWITAPAPFPVGELALAAYVAWLLVLAGGAVREVVRGPGPRAEGDGAAAGDTDATSSPTGEDARPGSTLRALARRTSRGAARLVRHAGILAASFYLLWGFHYSRPSLEARMELPDGAGADRDELVRLAERAVAATNEAYRAIHDTADAGEPTELGAGRRGLKAALETGWRRAAEEASLPGHYGWSYGPVKAFVPDGFLVKVGLGGYYFPWTGEAIVDGGTPAADLVQSIAHEQAHQRGVAPEDEASFMGFLAASRSPHPVARYSALLFAQRHLVAAAASGGRDELGERLAAGRLPGVERDLRDFYAYLQRRIRLAVRVTRNVNDAYLKSNRVEGGVASYGLVTRLLVAQARADGERLFPGSRADTASGPGQKHADAASQPGRPDSAASPHRSQPAQSGGASPK